MGWSSLKRAQRHGHLPLRRMRLLFASFLSAGSTAALILILGLIIDLLVFRGNLPTHQETYQDWAAEHSLSLEEAGILATVARTREWPLIGSAIRNAFVQIPWLRQNLSALLFLVGLGLMFALLQALSKWLITRWSYRSGLEVITRLREAIISQAFHVTGTEMLPGRASYSRELFDQHCEKLLESLTTIWKVGAPCGLRILLLLLLALLAGAWITLTALLFAALAFLFLGSIQKRSVSQRKLWGDRRSKLHTRLLDQLRLVPLVTGYNLSQPPGQETPEALRRHQEASYRVMAAEASLAPLKLLLLLIGFALILVLGGINILKGDASLAGTVILGTSLALASLPLKSLFQLRGIFEKADAAAAHIYALLDRDPTVGEAPNGMELPPISKDIKFNQVHLADRFGSKLMEDISVTIPAGAFIGIVGANPDMAPAFAGLLLRMFDPTAGQILYDDHDARQVTLNSLKERVIYVAGDGMIFSADIATNISCGDPHATQLAITEAAKNAHAYSFIQQLPQGFATEVDPLSPRLDLGQAFRIGLARALLRNPSVLIIQEPEGDLSERAAGYIDDAIHRARAGRTIIMLPSRPSTLRKVEGIALFNDGKLHASGTHAELIQSNALYRHLLYIRFNDVKETKA